MTPQTWIAKDIKTFSDPTDLANFVSDNGITCVFAIDALLTYKLFKGNSESDVDSTILLPNLTKLNCSVGLPCGHVRKLMAQASSDSRLATANPNIPWTNITVQ